MQIKTKVVLATVLAVGLVVALGSSVNLHGNVINADTGFQYQQAAPAGHTLVGNGSEYVDSGTQQDEWFTVTGCAAPTDGNSACTLTGNSLPTPMPDTNYFLSCTGTLPSADLSPSGSAGIGVGVSTAITSTSLFNMSVGYIGGSSTYFPYTATITCHAHHN